MVYENCFCVLPLTLSLQGGYNFHLQPEKQSSPTTDTQMAVDSAIYELEFTAIGSV